MPRSYRAPGRTACPAARSGLPRAWLAPEVLMLSSAPIYIVSAARTPIGAFLGSLSSIPVPRLGAAAIEGALERAKLSADQVGEVFMGNVLSAGVGQAPARQAAIYAKIPNSVPATTVSKV